MTKIVVTGTPGSGKSTILSKVTSIKIVSLADEMLKLAGEKGVTHRDKLRYMSYTDIADERKKVIEQVFNKMKEDAIIDTHITVKKGTRYVPGFTTADLNIFKGVGAFIYIDAHANDIMFRRLTDKTRRREDEPEEEIHEQRRLNMSLAAYYSAHLNVPLYIIKNRQNQIDNAVKDLEAAIKEILGK